MKPVPNLTNWLETQLLEKGQALLSLLHQELGVTAHPPALADDLIDSKALEQTINRVHEGADATIKLLAPLAEELEQNLKKIKIHSISSSVAKLHQTYERSMDFYIKIFRVLRKLHGKGEGDQLIDWRGLSAPEIALIPPMLVDWPLESLEGEDLSRLHQLLQGGRRIKLVIRRSHLLQPHSSSGRSLLHEPSLDLGMLALSYRSLHVVQGPWGLEGLEEKLKQAITAQRPSLIHCYEPEDTDLAALACRTRFFPYLAYDPDLAMDYAKDLDLSLNPGLDELWVSEEGEAMTPAHFAASCGEGEKMLHPAEEGTPLDQFMELPPNQRTQEQAIFQWKGKVFGLDLALLALCYDRAQVWKDLKLMAGLEHPLLEAKEKAYQEQLTLEKKAIRAQWEEEIPALEAQAIERAMTRLSQKLLGQGGLELNLEGKSLNIPLQGLDKGPVEAASAAPQSQDKEAGGGEEPWIESDQCTACDECTTINKRIFAYNESKQAVIKDAKAGPFSDIVKAAEKCSAKIIHPGQPLGKEKNLEKWIKRALPYQ